MPALQFGAQLLEMSRVVKAVCMSHGVNSQRQKIGQLTKDQNSCHADNHGSNGVCQTIQE